MLLERASCRTTGNPRRCRHELQGCSAVAAPSPRRCVCGSRPPRGWVGSPAHAGRCPTPIGPASWGATDFTALGRTPRPPLSRHVAEGGRESLVCERQPGANKGTTGGKEPMGPWTLAGYGECTLTNCPSCLLFFAFVFVFDFGFSSNRSATRPGCGDAPAAVESRPTTMGLEASATLEWTRARERHRRV